MKVIFTRIGFKKVIFIKRIKIRERIKHKMVSLTAKKLIKI